MTILCLVIGAAIIIGYQCREDHDRYAAMHESRDQ